MKAEQVCICRRCGIWMQIQACNFQLTGVLHNCIFSRLAEKFLPLWLGTILSLTIKTVFCYRKNLTWPEHYKWRSPVVCAALMFNCSNSIFKAFEYEYRQKLKANSGSLHSLPCTEVNGVCSWSLTGAISSIYWH